MKKNGRIHGESKRRKLRKERKEGKNEKARNKEGINEGRKHRR